MSKSKSPQAIVMKTVKVTASERARIRDLRRGRESMTAMLRRMEGVLRGMDIPRTSREILVPIRLDVTPSMAKLLQQLSRRTGHTQVDILRMVVAEMEGKR